jgi:hypothetical protein
MAGRHRRPPAWRRALTSAAGSLRSLLRSRDAARRAAEQAALLAEVVALRTTVGEMRAALDAAEARATALAAQLAQARAEAAAAAERHAAATVPGPALHLPLVRLALDRTAEPALTRDMALALAAPDRGADTATTEIVLPRTLADLPEQTLLDPVADRDDSPADPAAGAAVGAPAVSTAPRRIA